MRFHVHRDGAGLHVQGALLGRIGHRRIDAGNIDGRRAEDHRQPVRPPPIALEISAARIDDAAPDQAGAGLEARRQPASDADADNGGGVPSCCIVQIAG